MEILAQILGWILAVPLSLILLYLTLELSMGLVRLRNGITDTLASGSTGAILVPAHNEAAYIYETVKALRAAAPSLRIIVVADNCTDNTADIARLAGAEVSIRDDINRLGKGFALSFGRDYLLQQPADAVIIVDADCRLSNGSAELLVARAIQCGRPVQSVNLLVTDAGASPIVRISNFAMLIKNLVRARGLLRVGGGALLFGTGMAFPWKLFASLDLATSNAVEDLDLALLLANAGVRVAFEDGALVTSTAASLADSKGQRRRWEHGFLEAALQNGMPLLWAGICKRSRHLLSIGAHMMVPPLAILAIVCFVCVALLVASWYLFGTTGPLLLLSSCLTLASVALLAAWWIEGRCVINFRSLLLVPVYVLWKLPIYLGFFTSRQIAWNRTHREGEMP